MNLLYGIGQGGDADNDFYMSIEVVYGSPFNDTLIGDYMDYNELRGLAGKYINKYCVVLIST